jgi:hypothetical protein
VTAVGTSNPTDDSSYSVQERDHWEELDVDGQNVLKLMLKKQDGRVWTGIIWLRRGK